METVTISANFWKYFWTYQWGNNDVKIPQVHIFAISELWSEYINKKLEDNETKQAKLQDKTIHSETLA